uniref:Small ribosomal subunit protein uS17 n=1 Tax=Salmo salar TaxID=8030 RepID=B5XF40_SALSA|nr:40S ribosomal protein S11 [Salmo salar]ACI69460.1 40S ribosomal protein S11 [Salmo salar]
MVYTMGDEAEDILKASVLTEEEKLNCSAVKDFIGRHNIIFEKRHKNMSVHLSPAFRDVSVGDIVTVGECRPLSKTVRFNVLKVTKAAGAKKQFQKF